MENCKKLVAQLNEISIERDRQYKEYMKLSKKLKQCKDELAEAIVKSAHWRYFFYEHLKDNGIKLPDWKKGSEKAKGESLLILDYTNSKCALLYKLENSDGKNYNIAHYETEPFYASELAEFLEDPEKFYADKISVVLDWENNR